MAILTIIILTCVGLGCGIMIYIANRALPEETEVLQRTGKIAEILPGMNCGACGKPGCFAYAQALAEDPEIITRTPCMTAIQDEGCVRDLEDILGFKLELTGLEKKAVIHCIGQSEKLYDYNGISSCKAGAQLAAGYKKCPFGCLGLGDCVDACPHDAIHMDLEKGVAVVDHAKCIGCGLCMAECPHNLIELLPANIPHYLGCSYTVKKNIPGRERCDNGCTKCRKCIKASKEGEVEWDDNRNLPLFSTTPAPEAIEVCPVEVIVPIEQEVST